MATTAAGVRPRVHRAAGLTLDPQKDLVPVWDRDLGSKPVPVGAGAIGAATGLAGRPPISRTV